MEYEQVSVERAVDRAWFEFDMRLISIGTLYLLWGSIVSAEDLAERYLNAKGKARLLDKRRRLSTEEEDERDDVIGRAEAAIRYLEWARQEDAQPILRDALVAYCGAFENALKSVAVAFELYSRRPHERCIPARELNSMVDDIATAWKGAVGAGSGRSEGSIRAKEFFRDCLFARNPEPTRWHFADPDSSAAPPHGSAPIVLWETVDSAYQLRNVFLHANGTVGRNRIEGAGQAFHPREEACLTSVYVRHVESSMRAILEPLNPEQL